MGMNLIKCGACDRRRCDPYRDMSEARLRVELAIELGIRDAIEAEIARRKLAAS